MTGEPDEYVSSKGAKCPHCGYLNEASESDGLLYDEDTVDWTCGECCKEFDVSLYVSHSWTTRKATP